MDRLKQIFNHIDQQEVERNEYIKIMSDPILLAKFTHDQLNNLEQVGETYKIDFGGLKSEEDRVLYLNTLYQFGYVMFYMFDKPALSKTQERDWNNWQKLKYSSLYHSGKRVYINIPIYRNIVYCNRNNRGRGNNHRGNDHHDTICANVYIDIRKTLENNFGPQLPSHSSSFQSLQSPSLSSLSSVQQIPTKNIAIYLHNTIGISHKHVLYSNVEKTNIELEFDYNFVVMK